VGAMAAVSSFSFCRLINSGSSLRHEANKDSKTNDKIILFIWLKNLKRHTLLCLRTLD